MKRCFALTSLTVALFAAAIGCGPKKSLRPKRSKATDKATETVATSEAATPNGGPPAAAPAGPAPAPAPIAIPVAPAGVGGASGSGMAVVILMLPADAARSGGTATAAAARTYKLSLSANSDTATIQVDGQPAVTAPVQRVYPSAPRAPAVAAVRAAAVVAPRAIAAAPARPRYIPQPLLVQPEAVYDAPADAGEVRARQTRRATITTAMRPPLAPPVIINPNGAPIID